jgi:magnesium chelatase family protein
MAARAIQTARFAGTSTRVNGRMSLRQIHAACALDAAGQAVIEKAIARLGLSARAYARILKVARTIADLEGAERIAVPHLAEAIGYRSLDRRKA